MRVSLCVICGNESHHIETMLGAFAPAFDELSLVRAIGAKAPDDTVDKARAWCAANGKDFVFSEHLNQHGTEKWDHVDSFADARNQAFGQGTGDWLVWADCDDVLDQSSGTLRQVLAAMPEYAAMARFPYDVRGTGKKLHRERAIRRASFKAGRKWHNDVHENLLLLPGDKHGDFPAPVWVHAPTEIKRENRFRNLRILSRAASNAATDYFYIHQEHFCNQNTAQAIEYGKIAISFPNLPPAFLYECLINLAKLCGNPRDAFEYLMRAHGTFPWCREAIANLVLLYFERNDVRRATYWADRMLDLREPLAEERPWTHEGKWYGWAGYDLAARAFRLAGNTARAAVHQAQFSLGMKPKISLLHATRGRSSKAVGCRDFWLNSANNPSQVEHIFAVDEDDKVSTDMARQFISVISQKKSCVAAWNLAAREATGDLLVQLSDDWMPCQGWDEMLLREVAGRDLNRDQIVIAINDGHRKDDLLCMAILSRARLEAQGDLFFSGYESVFSDNEFSARAFKDKIVIDARDRITFQHIHPAFGKAPMDATYKHNNSRERYAAGEALFKERNP